MKIFISPHPTKNCYLIVKTSSLGDILQAFPVVKLILTYDPTASIDWVVEKRCEELPSHHPFISQIFVLDTKEWKKNKKRTLQNLFSFIKELRKKKYTALFDLQGNIKSGVISFFAKSHDKIGFSWNQLQEKPNWFFLQKHYLCKEGSIQEQYTSLIQQFFGKELPTEDSIYGPIQLKQKKELPPLPFVLKDPFVIVSVGSTWPHKELEEKSFAKLLLKQRGFLYFIWGSKQEEVQAYKIGAHLPKERVEFLGKLPLSLLQEVLSKASLVISMDSFALHLAGTTQTPLLGCFGPSQGKFFMPKQTVTSFFIQGSCPYKIEFTKRCPYLRDCPSGACLKAIPDEELFDFKKN